MIPPFPIRMKRHDQQALFDEIIVKKDHTMRRAVVVPVGCEPTIVGFVDELFLAVNPASIFFVIDGATDDRTRRSLNVAVATYAPSGHVFRGPGGLARAYHAGYRAAWAAGCESMLEMDVGHNVASAAKMLQAVDSGDADFAAGVRWGEPGANYDAQGAAWRWLLSRGGSALVELAAADHRLKDWTSGMHAMNRRVLEAVLRAVNDDFPPGRWWQTAVRVAAMREATKVATVPIAYKPTGKVPARDVVASLGRVARLWWNGGA